MGKSANISGGFSIAMFESRRVRRVRLILRRIVFLDVFGKHPKMCHSGETVVHVVNPR